MNSEIEAKFLAIDHDVMRKKLNELGAVCEQPMRLMRRAIIDNEHMTNGKDSYLRVRDEGDKVTMTYKRFDELSVDGAKEIEVIVSDFDDTVRILAEAGLAYRSLQESRRETWRLGGVEIVLDEWPWLRSYIEIEGDSESSLREAASKLGLSWNDAVFGDVMVAYRAEYPHLKMTDTVGNLPEVRFADPLPELLQSENS